jgi:hypothetical protein
MSCMTFVIYSYWSGKRYFITRTCGSRSTYYFTTVAMRTTTRRQDQSEIHWQGGVCVISVCKKKAIASKSRTCVSGCPCEVKKEEDTVDGIYTMVVNSMNN